MTTSERITDMTLAVLDLEQELVEALDFEYADGPPTDERDSPIEGCLAEAAEYGAALCALAALWREVGRKGEEAFRLARWCVWRAHGLIGVSTREIDEKMLRSAIEQQLAAC